MPPISTQQRARLDYLAPLVTLPQGVTLEQILLEPLPDVKPIQSTVAPPPYIKESDVSSFLASVVMPTYPAIRGQPHLVLYPICGELGVLLPPFELNYHSGRRHVDITTQLTNLRFPKQVTACITRSGLSGDIPIAGVRYYRCALCGKFELPEDCRWIDARPFCAPCATTQAITSCGHCGGLFPSSFMVKPRNDAVICFRCLRQDPNLIICERCGCWTSPYGQTHRCQGCTEYEERERQNLQVNHGIRDYGHKPTPIFLPARKKGTIYFGIELETDDYPSLSRAGDALLALPEHDKLFYMKRDGSLHNGGIEIVTHPATLDYHRNEFCWDKITKLVKAHGGKSHYTETCGLHIHFDKYALGPYHSPTNDENTLKLLFLIEKHWDKLLIFSRRSISQLRFTAPFDDKFRTYTIAQFNEAKHRWGRHKVLNIHPDRTYEFRLFRGTLNVNTLLASIELTDFLCSFVREHTLAHIYRVGWKTLVGEIKPKLYPNLEDYLIRKGLKQGVSKCALSSSNPEDDGCLTTTC